MTMPTRLTILILRPAPGVFVARSLEHDIAAQGDSLRDALDAWADVFAGQIMLDLQAGLEPLVGIPEAPQRCWDIFDRAEPLTAEPIRLPVAVPEPWMAAAMHPELRAA